MGADREKAGKGVDEADAAGEEGEAQGATEQEPALQFEKAEFDEAPAAMSCGMCQQSIEALYYQVGTTVTCGACRDRVVRALEGGKGPRPFLRATGYGVAAAALGSVVWYAIREVTGYEIGLVAIGVGILVGVAVKSGSGGLGGARYQALAVALTYLSITMTNLPIIVSAIAKQVEAAQVDEAAEGEAAADPAAPAAAPQDPAAPAAEQPASAQAAASSDGGPGLFDFVVACVFVFGLALASPFLAGIENILGIIILGIGLYEAWKINRYTPPAVAGPFAVQDARGARDGVEDRAA